MCKRWTCILTENTDILQSIVKNMYSHDVPALLYGAMTWRQKVILPNHLVQPGQYLVPLKPHFRVKWSRIMHHCAGPNIEDLQWLCDGSQAALLPGNNITPYHVHMFRYYEQYRRYCWEDSEYGNIVAARLGLAIHEDSDEYGRILSNTVDFTNTFPSYWGIDTQVIRHRNRLNEALYGASEGKKHNTWVEIHCNI